jgi:hypothetical protein
MPARALSVDYGSSSTVAALREPDGRGRLLLFDSSPLLPSAVCVDDGGALVGGQEAQHLARAFPERYEPNPKRHIGQAELLLGDRAYPVVDAVAVTLRLVAAAAIEATGAAPDTVTVTHPAGWAAPRRGILLDAARRAGLPEPTLVPEPVAAARHFRSRPDCPPGPLVVYDLGAGTCDVSVIADDGTVLAVDGIDDLGGADLDTLVVEMVAEAVPADRLDRWRAITAPTNGADRRYFRLLWDDARVARELLSRRSGTHLHLPALDLDAPVGRERFEQAAGPVLMRSAGLAAGLIGRAGTTPGELAGIVLVGGASRTPLVATLLHQTIGVAPTMLDQPELVVAQGGLRTTGLPAGSPTGPEATTAVAPGTEPAGGTAGAEPADPARLPGAVVTDVPISAGAPMSPAPSWSPPVAPDPAALGAVPGNGAPASGVPASAASASAVSARGVDPAPAAVEATQWPWWPLVIVLLLGLTVFADVDIVLGQDGRLPIPVALAALVFGGYATFHTARRAGPGRPLNWLAAAGAAVLVAAVLAAPVSYGLYGDDGVATGAALPVPFLLMCGMIAGLTAWRGGGGRRVTAPVALLGTALLYGASSAAVFVVVAVENPEDPSLAAPAEHIMAAGLIAALLAMAGLLLAGRRTRRQR